MTLFLTGLFWPEGFSWAVLSTGVKRNPLRSHVNYPRRSHRHILTSRPGVYPPWQFSSQPVIITPHATLGKGSAANTFSSNRSNSTPLGNIVIGFSLPYCLPCKISDKRILWQSGLEVHCVE